MTNSNGINRRILKEAISHLAELDLDTVESIQVNHTKYDDGSSLFEVGISFPTESKSYK